MSGTELIHAGDYDIDIIVQGYPGKSVCHGSLGWSTVALIRGHGHVGLIDTGSMGMRTMLIERLAKRRVAPEQISDLLITHSHHDHVINWTLFSKSRIVIGGRELEWALRQPWGETPVPELSLRELQGWPTLHAATNGEQVLPGVTAHLSPGHTPGSMIFVVQGGGRDVIFIGDAAKNRAEIASRTADMTCDAAQSSISIKAIWDLWISRPGTVLVPGHDLPMVQENGHIRYLGKREAVIQTLFGDDMETMQTFELTRMGH
ncbi:MAG: MBL fold metallo-hydrolase [Candidatus Acidiferrales bacterium]